jgi:hypothetical protein
MPSTPLSRIVRVEYTYSIRIQPIWPSCEKTARTQPKSSKTEWIDYVIGVQTHEEVRSKSRSIYTNTSMKFSQRGNKHEERHQDMAEQRRLPRRSGTRCERKLQHLGLTPMRGGLCTHH